LLSELIRQKAEEAERKADEAVEKEVSWWLPQLLLEPNLRSRV
jgi:hypothetical protein